MGATLSLRAARWSAAQCWPVARRLGPLGQQQQLLGEQTPSSCCRMPSDRHEALHLILGFCKDHGLLETYRSLCWEAGMDASTVRALAGQGGPIAHALRTCGRQ